MNIIATHPSAAMYATGLDIENCCARCGSSCGTEDCTECDGGWLGTHDEDEYGVSSCGECYGLGVWYHCLSSPEFCEAHPLPGREHTRRGDIEWYVIGG